MLGILIMLIAVVTPSFAQDLEAVAVVAPTSEASAVVGEIKFVATAQGVDVIGDVKGLTANSKHGFHVHEFGSCQEVGKAAGGHFNPHGVAHGFLPKDGHEKAHLGDMGNLIADANGQASVMVSLPGLTLNEDAQTGILNRAIIIHEKEDDFGQPLGNAGGRIGCGIIQLNQE